MRALPEQLGAPIAAPQADVRVEIEHGNPGEGRIALDECRIEPEVRERLPDRLMDGQRVRVVRQRVEEHLERGRFVPLRRQMT
jgi:hypothetical protein